MLVDRPIEDDSGHAAQTTDREIYDELGELAKYVEATTRALREMETPLATTADQLPQANDFLAELSRMTEEGTHKVMSLADAIGENRTQIKKALDDIQALVAGQGDPSMVQDRIRAVANLVDQDESRLLDISVALSFQDLVAQRVKKLVVILEDVQHKLLKLVVVFGLQQDKAHTDQEGRGYEMLKQLDQSKTTALEQDLVDNILGEFGFN